MRIDRATVMSDETERPRPEMFVMLVQKPGSASLRSLQNGHGRTGWYELSHWCPANDDQTSQ